MCSDINWQMWLIKELLTQYKSMRLSPWPPAGIYTNGQHAAGRTFLIFGRKTSICTDLPLSSCDASDWFKICCSIHTPDKASVRIPPPNLEDLNPAHFVDPSKCVVLKLKVEMKDPGKAVQDKDTLAVITCYERMIVCDKIRLDTERYKHRWSGHTYQILTELANSKVRCKCKACDLIRHQISLHLRKVFTWTNQFCSIIGKQRGVIGDICDEIFILIEGSHLNDFSQLLISVLTFSSRSQKEITLSKQPE